MRFYFQVQFEYGVQSRMNFFLIDNHLIVLFTDEEQLSALPAGRVSFSRHLRKTNLWWMFVGTQRMNRIIHVLPIYTPNLG